jgi:hypothetical protein
MEMTAKFEVTALCRTQPDSYNWGTVIEFTDEGGEHEVAVSWGAVHRSWWRVRNDLRELGLATDRDDILHTILRAKPEGRVALPEPFGKRRVIVLRGGGQ